jgi:hypothetical protein
MLTIHFGNRDQKSTVVGDVSPPNRQAFRSGAITRKMKSAGPSKRRKTRIQKKMQSSGCDNKGRRQNSRKDEEGRIQNRVDKAQFQERWRRRVQ